MFPPLRSLVLTLGLAALAVPAAAEPPRAELVLVETAGCGFCARWRAEVGPAWAAAPEGRAAPLRTVDLKALRLGGGDVALSGPPPRLAPTFLLVVDGREAGRIEGYANDFAFWSQVDAAWRPLLIAR